MERRFALWPRKTWQTSSISVALFRERPCFGLRMTRRHPFGRGRDEVPPDQSLTPTPSRCSRVCSESPAISSKLMTISFAKYASSNGSKASSSRRSPAKSRNPSARTSYCLPLNVGGSFSVSTAQIIPARPGFSPTQKRRRSSDVQASFARVALVSGDRGVVGLAPGARGAEGREDCVEGVAAAVAHDAEAVARRDADVAREAVENRASRAAAPGRERAALGLLVVLVRELHALQ